MGILRRLSVRLAIAALSTGLALAAAPLQAASGAAGGAATTASETPSASGTLTASTAAAAPTILHLLDYVAADYPEAVRDGQVVDAGEFAEQVEFVGRAGNLLASLPANPAKAALLEGVGRLAALVERKAPAAEVAGTARGLHDRIAGAYAVALAPRALPDPRRGQALYGELCAGCHGATGRGDGPAGRGLDPAPANFADRERMAGRSLFGLYNVVTLGVAGTGMPAFGQLPDGDRWALAFYAAGLPYTAADRAAGVAALGKLGAPPAGTGQPSLALLTAATPRAFSAALGQSDAALYAHLVDQPGAVGAGQASPLAQARSLVDDALAAAATDRAAAGQLAIRAYLEGFEPVEPALDATDGALRRQIEQEMSALRTELPTANFDALTARAETIQRLLATADARLAAPEASASGIFLSSFVILFREGLEAVLLVAAIGAFLRQSGRGADLPVMHTGWIAALGAGALTWFAASGFIEISGAAREVTEGVTALLAAVVLVYVGLWLHSRSNAQVWQKYLTALLGRSQRRWPLFVVAFLATYREAFEVILFYQALWGQATSARGALAGGIGVALFALAGCAWAILRLSVRLPLALFFRGSAVLLALLAILFAGQGIAALQEAGVIPMSALLPAVVGAVGVQATVEGLLAQLAVLTALLAGMAALRQPAVADAK